MSRSPLPCSRSRLLLVSVTLLALVLLLVPALRVSAQDYSCSADSDCGEGGVCTKLRPNLGVCTAIGDLMSPCTSETDCTATVEGESLTCRSLGDLISGHYCAFAGEPPVPSAFVCQTDSRSCAESGGTCVARSVTFGSPGLCVPVQSSDSGSPTCTIGGIPCEEGFKCTSSGSSDVIGEVGLCQPIGDDDDDGNSHSPPDTSTGPDTTPPPSSGGFAYCSCTCNGISVPGYMNMAATGCDKCNSVCWGALFVGCTRAGWQGTWGDTTNPMKGFVSGTCLKQDGHNQGGGGDGNDGGATADDDGNNDGGLTGEDGGGSTPPPPPSNGGDGGVEDGDGVVNVGDISAAAPLAPPAAPHFAAVLAFLALMAALAL